MRIIIAGPTASGKTELSLLLAEALNTSVISADSRQCYRRINIGTATPPREELRGIPHYNLSVLDLDREDTAVRFQERAAVWEKEVLDRSDHIIYAGGSTLYLQSLITPFDDIPDSNPENIKVLEQQADNEGIEKLYEDLKEADPAYIEKMDGMNRQRIIRALDVFMQTGKPFSHFHNDDPIQPDNNTLVYGLLRPRQLMYDRINERTDQMIEAGLVEELKGILADGYPRDLQALNTVGYKELYPYLDGEWTLAQAKEKIKVHTRRYAKRQMTWFRRWDFIEWLDAEHLSAKEMRDKVLEDLRKY